MNILTIVRKNKLKFAGVAGLSILTIVVGVGISLALIYHISPVSWRWYQPFDSNSGVALSGYDPVAYHTEDRAIKGKKEIRVNWKQAEWHFASENHKAIFESNPEQYAPQFGGHCALAISAGFTATSNPETWHIEKGRLYVFLGDDPKKDWMSKIPAGIVAETEKTWLGE